jgi:large subunit ribosomal protein L30
LELKSRRYINFPPRKPICGLYDCTCEKSDDFVCIVFNSVTQKLYDVTPKCRSVLGDSTIRHFQPLVLLRIALQMASLIPCRSQLSFYMRPTSNVARTLTTTTTTLGTSSNASAPPNTHFKITLRRSALSLGDKIKGTLKALGIHRRFQTVYFPHSPEVAGKILKVKELVEVENVPRHLVLTKLEQRQQRKSPRGYKIIGSRMTTFMHV